MKRKMNRKCAAAVLSGVIFATGHAGSAATVSWNNPAGGNWSDPNWTGGAGSNPPQPADTARFNIANTYNVNVDISPTVDSLTVGGSNVTFTNSTSGRTLTATSGGNINSGSLTLNAAIPMALIFNNNAGFNTNVSILNGSDFSGTLVAIGAASSSTTTVSGSGSSLSASAGVGLGTQSGRTGSLIFTNGASGSTSNTSTIGNTFGAIGNLTVEGGASINFNEIQIASTVSGSGAGAGTLTVTGAGTTMVTGGGTLAVGSPTAGPGTANFTSGSASTLNSGMTVNATGVVNVQSGATVSSSADISLTTNGSNGGKIYIDGASSSITQGGALAPLTVGSVAALGGIATLELTNGGTYNTGTGSTFVPAVTINPVGAINIASGTFNLNGNMTIHGGIGGLLQRGAGGTLNIASGKTLTVQSGGTVEISGGYSISPGATITVTGTGTSLDQFGSGALTIGQASQLNITSGASMSAAAEVVGGPGNGTVTQSSGVHNVHGPDASLRLADAAGTTGTYNLSGGSLSITRDPVSSVAEAVGYNGTGHFNHTGGSHMVGGINAILSIGHGPTAVGNYTISNGTLTVGKLYVGHDSGAQGTLTVNGGAVQVSNQFLQLGLNSGATGTANVNAGTLFAQGIYVGGTSTASGGTGVLNIAGGNVTSNGETRIWAPSAGQINLSAGSLTTVSLDTDGVPSNFNWTGGTLNITGASGMAIGSGGPLGSSVSVGSSETLTTSNTATITAGGTLTVAGGAVSASSIIDNGTLNVSSGTVTTSLLAAGNDGTLSGGSGTGSIQLTGGIVTASTVRLGFSLGGIGSLTLSLAADLRCDRLATNDLIVNGGSVLVSQPASPSDPVMDGSIVAGYVHDGAFIVTSGVVTTPNIKLGPTGGKTGTYNQSGGTVNVTTFGVGNDGTTSGGAGIGNATISGGTLNATNLLIGSSAGGVGTMTLASGGDKVLKASTLAIDAAGGSKLDLNDNDLIVDGGDYSAIEALVIQGFNGGDWLGNGITSSSAANDTLGVSALGIIDNAEFGYTEFSGQTGLNSDEILVKHTYYGDADVGGTVNNDDFVQFLAGYNEGAPAKWLNGDFDYNASVNLDDFALFLAGLQDQGDPRVSRELFANLAEFVAAEGVDVDLSTVPEPASVALWALGSLLLARRRGR